MENNQNSESSLKRSVASGKRVSLEKPSVEEVAPEYHVNFEKRPYSFPDPAQVSAPEEPNPIPTMVREPFPEIRIAEDVPIRRQQVQPQPAPQQQQTQQPYINPADLQQPQPQYQTKFCKFCGKKIPFDAVVCTACGRQVELLQQAQSQPTVQQVIQPQTVFLQQEREVRFIPKGGKAKNKWFAFVLCLFFGWAGAHKFYEGKFALGIAYLFTGGFFGFGWLIDLLKILFKSDETYYVE